MGAQGVRREPPPAARLHGRGANCRRECDFEPAARRFTELAGAREPPDREVLSIKGKAVDNLNDAREAYREKRAADAGAFVGVAAELVAEELLTWPSAGDPPAVRLEAKIEGSKAKCKFKVLRCAKGERPPLLSRVKRALGLEHGEQSPWREVAHWENSVDDVATVDVGTVDASLLADRSGRRDLVDALRGRLEMLVSRT